MATLTSRLRLGSLTLGEVVVRTGPDRFEPHDLTLGVPRPDIVEVRKGLSEADEVATDGNFQLKAILLGGTD